MKSQIPMALNKRLDPTTGADHLPEQVITLNKSWASAPEALKVEVTRALAAHSPRTFKLWFEGAGITGFTPKVLAMRPPAFRDRLDETARNKFPILAKAIRHYFTEWAPGLNHEFLRLMRERGVEKENSDPVVVEEVLDQLRATWPPKVPGEFDLFQSALRALTPAWWQKPENLPVEQAPALGVSMQAPAEAAPSAEIQREEPPVQARASADSLQAEGAVALTKPDNTQQACSWCHQERLVDWLTTLESELHNLEGGFSRARSAKDMARLAVDLEVLETRMQVFEGGSTPCPSSEEVTKGCLRLRTLASQGLRAPGVMEALVEFRTSCEALETRRRAMILELIWRQEAMGLPVWIDCGPVSCSRMAAEMDRMTAGSEAIKELESHKVGELRRSLQTLEERYHLNADRTAKRDRLMTALEAGGSYLKIQEGLEALTKELDADRLAWRHDKLAVSLIREGLRGPALVGLAQALLATGDVPLALAYLRTLQELPVEDCGLEDFSPFIATLLEALASLEQEGLWLDLLGDQPWLGVLARQDIQDEKTAAALGGILLAAEFRAPGAFSHLWNGLRCPAVLASAPTLGHLADAVTTHRDWAWANPRAAAELEASRRAMEATVGNVLADLIKTHKQFRDYFRQVQLRLRQAWTAVREGRAVDLDPEDLCRAFAAEARGQAARRFLCQEFNEDIENFVQSLRAHQNLERAFLAVPDIILDRESFRSEVAILANDSLVLGRIWATVSATLEFVKTSPPLETRAAAQVPMMLACNAYCRLLPEAVKRFNADPGAGPILEDLSLMVERIASPLALQEVMEALRTSGSLVQLCRLQAEHGQALEEPGPQVHADHLKQRVQRYIRAERQGDLLKALAEGRFAWVEREVGVVEHTHDQDQQFRSAMLNTQLREIRDTLRTLQDLATESNGEEAWRRDTLARLEDLLRVVMKAAEPQRTVEEKQNTLDRFNRSMQLIKDHVRYQGRDFRLLDLPPEEFAAPGVEPGPLTKDADREFLRTLAEDLAERTDSREVRESIGEFLKTFARITKMFSYREDPTNRAKLMPLVDFPFKWLATAFQKPGCYFFEQPLRLYLIPGPNPSRDLLERVRGALEDNRGQAIPILILPGLAKNSHRVLEEEQRFGDLVVLDQASLRTILSAPRAHSALRQILRRRTSLEIASPFLSTGNVDKEKHIYVSIGKIAERIQDGRNWIILGGRRSGKSTLLHAVEKAFLAKKIPHLVALDSLETLLQQVPPGGDLDLLVAQKIAYKFGWPKLPESLEAFERDLLSQARATRSCVLVDEVDSYVQWHQSKGQNAYPVIRCLRSVALNLRNSTGGGLYCFFTGFKDLYKAYRDPNPADSSYPWGNWVEKKVMPPMTLPETQTMVEEGFSDLLGLEVDQAVSPLIFKYTAGHPAFAQELCSSILSRLEVQGRSSETLRITQDEVNNAYLFTGDGSGHTPFIQYVNATLNMNLYSLDKVVAYMIAVSVIGKDEDPETVIPRSSIEAEVKQLFDLCERPLPTPKDLEEALSNLTMTGMLQELPKFHSYKMTFPTFVDILRRLEAADKEIVFRLIKELEG